MAKRVFASISLLTVIVAGGCARPLTLPDVPATVPDANHTVRVIAKDKVFGGCSLDVTPKTITVNNGQSIRWVLVVQDAECLSSDAPVKVVMKWKDCRGRPTPDEPLNLDPPNMGYQTGTVKPGAVKEQRCYQYGVFAGTLYKDPELIIDL